MRIHRAQSHQREELARLVHTSLDTWHRDKLKITRFGDDWRGAFSQRVRRHGGGGPDHAGAQDAPSR